MMRHQMILMADIISLVGQLSCQSGRHMMTAGCYKNSNQINTFDSIKIEFNGNLMQHKL